MISNARPCRLVSLVALIALTLGPGLSALAEDDQGFFRFDPIAEELITIGEEDLRPGYIYSHFDRRQNRQVWSYYLGGGEFWHGLGPGSVIDGRQFDVPGSIESLKQRAEQLNPRLLEQYERRRRSLRFRLQEDNTWKLLPMDAVRQVYELDTRLRWEEHGGRYIPVRHSAGSRWNYRNDRFVPAHF